MSGNVKIKHTKIPRPIKASASQRHMLRQIESWVSFIHRQTDTLNSPRLITFHWRGSDVKWMMIFDFAATLWGAINREERIFLSFFQICSIWPYCWKLTSPSSLSTIRIDALMIWGVHMSGQNTDNTRCWHTHTHTNTHTHATLTLQNIYWRNQLLSLEIATFSDTFHSPQLMMGVCDIWLFLDPPWTQQRKKKASHKYVCTAPLHDINVNDTTCVVRLGNINFMKNILFVMK